MNISDLLNKCLELSKLTGRRFAIEGESNRMGEVSHYKLTWQNPDNENDWEWHEEDTVELMAAYMDKWITVYQAKSFVGMFSDTNKMFNDLTIRP